MAVVSGERTIIVRIGRRRDVRGGLCVFRPSSFPPRHNRYWDSIKNRWLILNADPLQIFTT